MNSLTLVDRPNVEVTRLAERGEWTAAKFGNGVGIRTVDVLVSILALVVLLPLMMLLWIAVVVTDPGPALFGQVRIGRNGRLFRCFKFRSMVVDADARLEHVLATDPVMRAEWERDHKFRHDPRLTPIGRWLRKSSFDELPQLFNVLRGDMSLVGPRPIVAAEIRRYGRYINDYYKVRPGITGLWQISGRSNLSYRRRVAIDTMYVRNKSFSLDLRILLITIPAVVSARGSY